MRFSDLSLLKSPFLDFNNYQTKTKVLVCFKNLCWAIFDVVLTKVHWLYQWFKIKRNHEKRQPFRLINVKVQIVVSIVRHFDCRNLKIEQSIHMAEINLFAWGNMERIATDSTNGAVILLFYITKKIFQIFNKNIMMSFSVREEKQILSLPIIFVFWIKKRIQANALEPKTFPLNIVYFFEPWCFVETHGFYKISNRLMG